MLKFATSVISSAYIIVWNKLLKLATSFMYIKNRRDPSIEPWGTPGCIDAIQIRRPLVGHIEIDCLNNSDKEPVLYLPRHNTSNYELIFYDLTYRMLSKDR